MNSLISRVTVQHVCRSAILKNVGSQHMRLRCTKRTTSFEEQQAKLNNPIYLSALEPEVPQSDKIDIMMKGYDFVVLENLQSKVHALAETMNLDVTDGWAVRAQSFNVTKLKPRSAVVEEEIPLKLYQRVLQVDKVPSNKIGILLEALQAIAPPGVTCTLVNHTPDIDADRYVPDSGLKELQEQLEEVITKK